MVSHVHYKVIAAVAVPERQITQQARQLGGVAAVPEAQRIDAGHKYTRLSWVVCAQRVGSQFPKHVYVGGRRHRGGVGGLQQC